MFNLASLSRIFFNRIFLYLVLTNTAIFMITNTITMGGGGGEKKKKKKNKKKEKKKKNNKKKNLQIKKKIEVVIMGLYIFFVIKIKLLKHFIL